MEMLGDLRLILIKIIWDKYIYFILHYHNKYFKINLKTCTKVCITFDYFEKIRWFLKISSSFVTQESSDSYLIFKNNLVCLYNIAVKIQKLILKRILML